MSGCGGNCNCGSNCSCTSCGKMYPDMETGPTMTIIQFPQPKRFTNKSEESFGAEGSENDGCKCGSNCNCGDNCNC